MSDTKPLKGRVALVTGAGVGIGRAIALALGDAGAAVGVHCRESVSQAEEVAQFIRADGGQAWVLQADLADPKQAGQLVGRLIEHSGRLDILVNNAGSPVERSRIEDCSNELWQQVIATNLTSAFVVTRSAIPHLRATGHGSIVNNLTL